MTVAYNVYVGLGTCKLVYGAGLCSAIQGELIHASVHGGEGGGGRAHGWGWQGEVPLETVDLTHKTNMITTDGIECEVFLCQTTKVTKKNIS